MVEIGEYDFKGQPKYKIRQVLADGEILSTMPTSVYRVDWLPSGTSCTNEGTLLAGSYRTDMAYDALGRPTTITLPMDVNSGRKEVTPVYNRAGAMTAIKLNGDEYVSRIAYNAKGQRILVTYDHPDLNSPFMTRYAYDLVNFRLLRQKTEDYAATGLTFTPQSGSTRQDCAYVYDLAGNIVAMKDDSPAAGVGGASGPFSRGFDYDALYRLVKATGREAGSHLASSDPNFKPTPDASVGGTVGYYRTYSYDKLGNMLELYHHGGSGNQFHRVFNSGSSNPFELSNLATDIEYAGTVVNYTFDANGNMLTEGSGRSFGWDYGDRMRGFAEGTTTAAYMYDASGNRVKKVVRKSAALKEVTVYIDGGFEYLYTLDGTNTVHDETNEVHVMDGRSRVARVKVESGQPDEIKYNLEDHLGNASFTMNGDGSLILREEYFPFGETSFGGYLIKRYRFCGKERDEESGLYYYGARYYAPWSCRFVSIDPLAGKYPFYTPYQYAGNQPVNSVDLDGLEKDPKTDTGGSGGGTNRVNASSSQSTAQGGYQWGSGSTNDNIVNFSQKNYAVGYTQNTAGPKISKIAGVKATMAELPNDQKSKLPKAEFGHINTPDPYINIDVINAAPVGRMVYPEKDYQTMATFAKSLVVLPNDQNGQKFADLNGTERTCSAFLFSMVCNTMMLSELSVGLGFAEGAGVATETSIGLSSEARATLSSSASGSRNTMFHYTSQGGYDGILETMQINPSLGPGNNAFYGEGVYFTDLVPNSTGSIHQMARQLTTTPWSTNRVTHYFEVDVSNMNLIFNKEYNYLMPTTESLPISEILVGHGKASYSPIRNPNWPK